MRVFHGWIFCGCIHSTLRIYLSPDARDWRSEQVIAEWDGVLRVVEDQASLKFRPEASDNFRSGADRFRQARTSVHDFREEVRLKQWAKDGTVLGDALLGRPCGNREQA